MELSKLLPFIEHIHSFAYWFAFFAALLETFVGLGLIVPGTTIIIFLGSLATEGYFKIYDLYIFVVLGALLGNIINYIIGKRLGPKLKAGEIKYIKPIVLEKATLFFDKHGGKSIFIGRFIPSLRETVSLIAGISNMKKTRFFFWTLLGSLTWGAFATYSGYYFNHYLKISKLLLTRSGIFMLLIILFFILLYYFKKSIIRRGNLSIKIAKSITKSATIGILNNEHVERLLKKYPRFFNFFINRFDNKQFLGLPITCFFLIIVYLSCLFGGLIEDILHSDVITFADIRIANLLTYFRHDFYSRIFLWITILGKMEIVLFISILMLIIFYSKKKYEYIWSLVIGIVGSTSCLYFGKLIFHRPRPYVALYLEKSFSFPSGHATISVLLYGFICYVILKNSEKWKTKVNAFFITLVVIGLIGFSRLYLGVHFLSDVLGGYLLGAIWLFTIIAITEYRLYHQREVSEKLVFSKNKIYALTVMAILVYFFYGYNYKPRFIYENSSTIETITNPLEIFKNENLKYTESILGQKQEPISFIIVAKSDYKLIQSLNEVGWYLADEVNVLNFLNFIKADILNIPYQRAPMAPDFWDSNVNNFGFEKPTKDNTVKTRHHSRFWKTRFKTVNGDYVYVGSVSLDKNIKWGITHQIAPNIDEEREQLLKDLNNYGVVKKYYRVKLTDAILGKNFLGDPFFTDGECIILEIK